MAKRDAAMGSIALRAFRSCAVVLTDGRRGSSHRASYGIVVMATLLPRTVPWIGS